MFSPVASNRKMKNFIVFDLVCAQNLFLYLYFLLKIFRLHRLKQFWKFGVLWKSLIFLMILRPFYKIFDWWSTLSIFSYVIWLFVLKIGFWFVIWKLAKLWPKWIQILIWLIKFSVKTVMQRWFHIEFTIFRWVSFFAGRSLRWMS